MKFRDKKLIQKLGNDISRKDKAAKESPTLLAQTVYLGTVGILMVIPITAGAYLGEWLDQKLPGFSFNWTLTLILIGVFIGALNVYIFLRENQ